MDSNNDIGDLRHLPARSDSGTPNDLHGCVRCGDAVDELDLCYVCGVEEEFNSIMVSPNEPLESSTYET